MMLPSFLSSPDLKDHIVVNNILSPSPTDVGATTVGLSFPDSKYDIAFDGIHFSPITDGDAAIETAQSSTASSTTGLSSTTISPPSTSTIISGTTTAITTATTDAAAQATQAPVSILLLLHIFGAAAPATATVSGPSALLGAIFGSTAPTTSSLGATVTGTTIVGPTTPPILPLPSNPIVGYQALCSYRSHTI